MWKKSAFNRVGASSIGSCTKRPMARSAALAARAFRAHLKGGRIRRLSTSPRRERWVASCSAARSMLGHFSSKKSATTAILCNLLPSTCATLSSLDEILMRKNCSFQRKVMRAGAPQEHEDVDSETKLRRDRGESRRASARETRAETKALPWSV